MIVDLSTTSSLLADSKGTQETGQVILEGMSGFF